MALVYLLIKVMINSTKLTLFCYILGYRRIVGRALYPSIAHR